jgi:hypothetical protein
VLQGKSVAAVPESTVLPYTNTKIQQPVMPIPTVMKAADLAIPI